MFSKFPHFVYTSFFRPKLYQPIYSSSVPGSRTSPLLILLESVILFHLVAVQIIKSFISEYSLKFCYIFYVYPNPFYASSSLSKCDIIFRSQGAYSRTSHVQLDHSAQASFHTISVDFCFPRGKPVGA